MFVMKHIRIALRILLGLVFIFSGFVKGIDPMGSAIKFSEYFEVFHLSWLGSLSLILSVLQSSAEFLIGIALVVGLRMVVTAWSALVFMLFYTILTLYIAIANPVTDCGCFGDALVITNWQTFYKNIVMLGITVLIFRSRKLYIPYASAFKEWILVAFFAGSMTWISVYCYNHLPVVDFMPYHVGAHIPSQMVIPDGAPVDEYSTTLYYERDGIVKEFTIDNYPAEDSTWIFKDSKSVLIKEGYKPPIHGFSIIQEDGVEITEQVLADSNYSILFVSPNLSDVKPGNWKQILQVYEYTQKKGINFYFLNGSPHDVVIQTKEKYKLPFTFYFTDVTTLKTIIRSNPGMVLLKEGIILGKWHYNDIPVLKGKEPLLSYVLTNDFRKIERKTIWIIGLGLITLLFILWFIKKKN
jgi:uncharacterized membrane protein YphA (DoxX/SURF4 family)